MVGELKDGKWIGERGRKSREDIGFQRGLETLSGQMQGMIVLIHRSNVLGSGIKPLTGLREAF